ncbi:MAG: hypothetical protein PF637_03120 [Spirochaetes bacterium]|jgi:DNA-binding phage protein|nr:hypothetical protein [Spirochaetota bacterium]
MKHYPLIVAISVLLFSCASDFSLTEAEVEAVWSRYYEKEFIDSFKRELSSVRRRELMSSVASDYGMPVADLFSVLKEANPEMYKKLFSE